MKVTTDDLGVVAFVLPGRPNTAFELHEWPDGSFSLEPVDSAKDVATELALHPAAQHDLRADARRVAHGDGQRSSHGPHGIVRRMPGAAPHPFAAVLADVAAGHFPPADGAVQVLPALRGGVAAQPAVEVTYMLTRQVCGHGIRTRPEIPVRVATRGRNMIPRADQKPRVFTRFFSRGAGPVPHEILTLLLMNRSNQPPTHSGATVICGMVGIRSCSCQKSS